MRRCLLLNGVLLAVAMAAMPAYAQAIPKKLIEFGWDMKGPTEMPALADKMQALPFDGTTFRSTLYSYTFHSKADPSTAAAADIKALTGIKWGKLTDNFFYFVAGANVDWFDDTAWAEDGYILKNIAACAKVAHESGCAGLLFDTEFVYWGDPLGPEGPWKYKVQPHAKDKTFVQFEVQVRKRGAQFMRHLQSEWPEPMILTTFLNSCPRLVDYAKEPDPDKRRQMLAGEYYGLLPAFLAGMLDAANPGAVIADGNETQSYAYYKPVQYYEGYLDIHQTVQTLVPPELRLKYRGQVECAHAIWVDSVCYLKGWKTTTARDREKRAKWIEHNVYYALKTTDHYAWFYSEHMNWWTGDNMPPYLTNSINAAREKIARGQPLGYDIAGFWVNGRWTSAPTVPGIYGGPGVLPPVATAQKQK